MAKKSQQPEITKEQLKLAQDLRAELAEQVISEEAIYAIEEYAVCVFK